jgi:hypothetical protein
MGRLSTTWPRAPGFAGVFPAPTAAQVILDTSGRVAGSRRDIREDIASHEPAEPTPAA